MIEHYSTRIQNVIQRELFNAKKSIKVAIAWFTNDLLFQPIALKLALGVQVEIIINDDNINRNSNIDFSSFVCNGGLLRWNTSDRLMHDKFCIIDDRIVIFGSYNWTLKAEFNEESITIAREEPSTLKFYQNIFANLSAKYALTNSNQTYQIEQNNDKSFHPIKLFPYLSLNFYENLEIRCTFHDCIDYYFIWHGEFRTDRKYCFLDESSFLPILDLVFEDYCLINRSNLHNNIWLKVVGKWGLFNFPNKLFLISPQYESISPGDDDLNNSLFAVKKNGLMGVIDPNGAEVLPLIFSKVHVVSDFFIELEKNGKKGVWCKGRMLFDCIYDELYTDGKRPSLLNGKYGLVHGGKIILPFEYDEIKYIEPFGILIHYMRKNGKWGGHLTSSLHWKEKMVPCIYNTRGEVNKQLGV